MKAFTEINPAIALKFRIYCRETPGHMHCRVFVTKRDDAGSYESAICGSLTVCQGAEFDALKRDFANAEFLDDPNKPMRGEEA